MNSKKEREINVYDFIKYKHKNEDETRNKKEGISRERIHAK